MTTQLQLINIIILFLSFRRVLNVIGELPKKEQITLLLLLLLLLYISHGVGPLVERFLSHVSRSLFRDTCQSLKFPLNGLRAQSRLSPAVGLLPLASGPTRLEMAFPPFLVKQL